MSPSAQHARHLPRRSAVLVTAVVAALVTFLGGSAYADPEAETDAAIAAFQDGALVYVSPTANQQVDTAAVTDAIGDPPMYIAVLGPNVPVDDVLFAAPNVLSGEYTLVVVSGTQHATESTAYCAEHVTKLLDDTSQDHQGERQGGDLTGWLTDFAGGADELPAAGSAECVGASGGSGDSGSTNVIWWVLGVLLLGAGGGYLWLRSRQRKHDAELAGYRAKTDELLARLGGEIDQARPTDDPITVQAFQDAAARHDSAVDLLEAAETEEDIFAARVAVLEGLTASQVARGRAGQPTSDVPKLPAPYGERLEGPQELEAGDEIVIGYPTYTPGAPYYHRGGDGYSTGWYTAPVWEGAIIGSVLDAPSGEFPLPGPDYEPPQRG